MLRSCKINFGSSKKQLVDYKSLAKKCQLQLKISEAKLAPAVASF
jgi:hypothetical protein